MKLMKYYRMAQTYVEGVDEMYLRCKKNRFPPTHERWAMFSAKINRPLRKMILSIPAGDRRAWPLNWAFQYWWNCTHTLRLLHQTRLGLIQEKKKLKNDRILLKDLIYLRRDAEEKHALKMEKIVREFLDKEKVAQTGFQPGDIEIGPKEERKP